MITEFSYEGMPISFGSGEKGCYVNATEMAKKFGKKAHEWLRLPSTKEFLAELSEVRKSLFVDNQLVITKKGGLDPSRTGTWLHEDVALEFARWLSPKFAVWCNDRIKELMTKGETSLFGDAPRNTTLDATEWAMRVLNVNASGRLLMARKAFKSIGVDTNILPEYTESKGVLKSATDLLKEGGYGMSAAAFNKRLIEQGYLAEMTRTTRKGEKKYKNITEKGLEYGENLVSDQNQRETQPMWYAGKFGELVEKVNNNNNK